MAEIELTDCCKGFTTVLALVGITWIGIMQYVQNQYLYQIAQNTMP